MASVRHQRFTIFADDDVTPILGSPTCTTDPAGSRPYLKRVFDISESEVDFLNGSSTIGQISIEILDKRTDAADQTTGWFTAIMGSSGVNVLGGHRCLFEQQDDTGAWRVVMNGVIGDIVLDENKVKYRVSVRDMREREREMKLFGTHTGISTVLPPGGVVAGWGLLANGKYVVPAATPLRAKFYLEPSIGGKVGIAVFANQIVDNFKKFRNTTVMDYVQNMCTLELVDPSATTFDGAFAGAMFRGVEIWWRAAGSGGAYTKLQNLPWVSGSQWLSIGGAGLFKQRLSYGQYGSFPFAGSNSSNAQALAFVTNNPALMPSDTQSIDLLVIGARVVPTDDDPLYIETSFGQLLKDIYDGNYSPGDTVTAKYDAAAMAAFVASTPKARLRITAPVDDARTWIEENIYKPLGAAPSFNANGEIKPIFSKLPTADDTFVQLDDTNIASGSWQHSQKSALTKVVFKYKLDGVMRNPDGVYTVVERSQEYVEIDSYASVIGSQAIEFEPESVRSITDMTGASSNGGLNVGDFLDDTGGKLARERAHDILTRFSHGAAQLSLECIVSNAAVAGIENGDWVIVASSWMPDYTTGKRGINRIFQVIGVSDASPSKRVFSLLDAGPYAAPLATPTITGVSWDATNGAIKVDITNVAGTRTVMQMAVSATLPDANSGLWQFAGRLDATGSLRIFDSPTGQKVYVRARSEAAGRISSAWTSPLDFTVTGVPRVYDATLTLRDGSAPIITWNKSSDCLGVRVQYAVYEAGNPIPTAYTTFGDFNAADLGATLTALTVLQYQNVQIRLIAYPGWSGSAVTGSPGASVLMSGQRVSDTFVPPTVNETISATGTTATLQITPLQDPQYRIVTYEFRTRTAADGAWSGWSSDGVAPFEQNITQSVSEIVQIEYRFSIINQENQIVVFGGNVISMPNADGTAYNECRASVTAVSATTITVTVTGHSLIGPSTVHLVAVTGSASLNSGPAIGATGQASGTVWVFNRGAFGTGSGQVQFRATSASPLEPTDDDFVDIPEVGRDTVFLSSRARITASTDTTVTVRVAVIDPYPQGTNSATITYQSSGVTGVSPASGQTCTPASTFTEAAGTYVDFTITRALFSSAIGRVTFTVTAANRIADSDSVEVAASPYMLPAVEITIESNQSSSDTTAKASAVINAPEDIYDIRWLASTSAYPSQSTTATTGTIVTRASPGVPFTISDLGVSLAFGDTVYISVQPRTASGAFTNVTFIQAKARRSNLSATKTAYYVGTQFNWVTTPNAALTTVTAEEDAWRVQFAGGVGPYYNLFELSAAIPQGATITGVGSELYEVQGSSGTTQCQAGAKAVASGSTFVGVADFATMNGTNLGAWETRTASCSQATTGNKIKAYISLAVSDSVTVADDVRCRAFYFVYIPSTIQGTV